MTATTPHLTNEDMLGPLASRYVAGLYKARSNRNAQMYVTRGVGTVGLPLRLNCPPEVTQVILV